MEVTAAEIRKLVDRPATGAPVTSVYLNTDGARFPRPADYEARLDGLLRQVRRDAEPLDEAARESVLRDADAISKWVRTEFVRSDVRGLGVFAMDGEVFETVQVAIGVRNVARINDTSYVVPLEVLLGRHHHIGMVVIERNQARILRYRLGRLEQYVGLVSDVHRQHEQGGWSQARFQRTVDNEAHQHMKEAAEILRKAHGDDAFDAIVIAGPHVEAMDFIKMLHPYLTDLVHGDPMSIDLTANSDEIRSRLSDVEQSLVSGRRSHLLRRLAAARGSAEKGAFGLRHVLEAVNRKAVEVLFVVEGSGEPGFRSETGALALHSEQAAAFGGAVEPVDDLIDEIIEQAVRGGAHIEFFRDEVRLDGYPVAALLRF
ncbi:MAG: hypothetical protein GEU81_09805 [Nitriliruptorales bacterium]|nr:hypothetical protein [Nitriliruptorales bacterium]